MTVIAAAVRHRASRSCDYVGGSMHCYIHNVDEVGEGAYRICGECFHVYRTVADLLAANLRVLGEMALASLRSDWVGGPIDLPAPTMDPDMIYACPLCTHDF